MNRNGAVCAALAASLFTFAECATAAEAKDDSASLFLEMHRVLSHPRCVNCHPKGDSPRQGNDAHLHVPPMTRGQVDMGAAGMHCDACHQAANFPASGVPGAPAWHLAPRAMAWEGKSAGEICRQMLDRRRNGDRTLAQVVAHLTEDKLVAWGWDPGIDVSGKPREPVPIPKSEFNRIVQAWAQSGAACPK